jgi:hypothetical protein
MMVANGFAVEITPGGRVRATGRAVKQGVWAPREEV